MSILLLYRRIFTTTNRAFRIGLYATMAYVTLWMLAVIPLTIFQCTPIKAFWSRTRMPPGSWTCVDAFAAQIAMSVLNVIGDLAVLLLPSLALYNLKMSSSRKVAVAAIFLVGLL